MSPLLGQALLVYAEALAELSGLKCQMSVLDVIQRLALEPNGKGLHDNQPACLVAPTKPENKSKTVIPEILS